VRHAFENELGVQPPLGFWDPAGYTNEGSTYEFFRRRCVEIKHGRVSMIACIGYIIPEYFKWPGYLSPSSDLKFADVPHGLAAMTKVPALGWFQGVYFCGLLELLGAHQEPEGEKTPGQLVPRVGVAQLILPLEFGFLGIPNGPRVADAELRRKKLNAELANGRLAMTAIMAMMFQNGTVGTTGPAMWLPSSALPKVLEGTGGPYPTDVWDPANLMEGKSEEQILYWRAVELKHGRVCMAAVVGWFHVAAGWHPIGDAAARMRVSDDPMINVTQCSMSGMMQLLFTIMILEWFGLYVSPPPKERPWDVLGWTDIVAEEPYQWRERQLMELNNSRLAMFGIVGLIAQEVYTGDYFPGVGQTGGGLFKGYGFQDWKWGDNAGQSGTDFLVLPVPEISKDAARWGKFWSPGAWPMPDLYPEVVSPFGKQMEEFARSYGGTYTMPPEVP
jgi:hypothetical protein